MNSADAGILARAFEVVETPPRDPLPDGTCVGPYRIRSLIASGGMGDVYRAHDERIVLTHYLQMGDVVVLNAAKR
jgi:hypothetical protein